MNLLQGIKRIANKIRSLNQKAHNPFTERDFSYNPFESVFTRTYVWIEGEDDSIDINTF